MKRISRLFLLWTWILCACSAGVAFPQTVPASTTEAPPTLPATSTTEPTAISTASTPQIAQPPNPQDCGYQWANQDLPELSSSFQQSIQTLQPEAQASAYAFGENCFRSDGSVAGFSAMETDFNITLQVDDLANISNLGQWLVKVMQVIESIPTEQIAGPRPGRVSIVFQSNADQSFINFYIDQYQALPSGLSDSEIYQRLQTPQ